MIDNILREKAAHVGEVERRRLDKTFSFNGYVVAYAVRFSVGAFAAAAGSPGAVLLAVWILNPYLITLPQVAALALLIGSVGGGLGLMWALHDQVQAYDQFNLRAYHDRITMQAPPPAPLRTVTYNSKDISRTVEIDQHAKTLRVGGKDYEFPGSLIVQMVEAINQGDLKVTRDKFRKPADGKGYFSGPAWERIATGANGWGAMATVGYWDNENEWTQAGIDWVTR